jgi:hypothetical protein
MTTRRFSLIAPPIMTDFVGVRQLGLEALTRGEFLRGIGEL